MRWLLANFKLHRCSLLSKVRSPYLPSKPAVFRL